MVFLRMLTRERNMIWVVLKVLIWTSQLQISADSQDSLDLIWEATAVVNKALSLPHQTVVTFHHNFTKCFSKMAQTIHSTLVVIPRTVSWFLGFLHRCRGVINSLLNVVLDF